MLEPKARQTFKRIKEKNEKQKWKIIHKLTRIINRTIKKKTIYELTFLFERDVKECDKENNKHPQMKYMHIHVPYLWDHPERKSILEELEYIYQQEGYKTKINHNFPSFHINWDFRTSTEEPDLPIGK